MDHLCRILTLAFLLLGPTYSFAQVCSADFTYSMGTNNTVAFSSSQIINGCTPTSSCCVSMVYGDSTSAILNTWTPWGWNHFFQYPGVYNSCIIMSYQNGSGCSCSDTTCHPITIADTGSFCEASYCYEAVIDTNGMMSVTFTNTSTADDSITDVYWDFYDGNQSTDYSITDYKFFVSGWDQPTYLYIQTASGCQSAVVDTLVIGNTCLPMIGVNPEIINPVLHQINIYPNPFSNRAMVKFENPKHETLTLTLLDIQGRVLRTVPDITSEEVVIDKGDLDPGLYFIQLVNSKEIRGSGMLIVR